MLIVNIKRADSLERALKILKRKVIDTKQLQNLRNRKEFEKPSVKRRSEINKAKYIQKKWDADNK
jgi:small subunit ribosomal protein S21